MVAGFVANNSDPGSPTISEERSQSLVDYSFFPSDKSEFGSCSRIWNETNPDDFSVSISTLFPANNSNSDANSESNETPPRLCHYSNSIVSFFSPARSQTDSSSENYEIIIPNPSITTPSSFSHFFPLPNGQTSLSIPLIFPPTMTETETEESCSESNKTPRAEAQFSCSIVSLFPPARSQTDSSSCENYEIIPTDHSISASPRRTIRTAIFKHLTEFLKPKSNNSLKFSHPKKNSILSAFSAAIDLINIIHSKQFPLQMLLKATNNFSKDNKIETRSSGSAYRAILSDGREVAVKRKDNDHAFQCELKTLSRLNHSNLIRLLGYCKDRNVRILVYKYMKNGTLYDHLHELKSTPLMSWATRIKVALDAARGIEYLHVYAVPPIIHRNIKSSNILLDDTWTAKVSDFSLSEEAPEDEKSHHWSDDNYPVVGTIGYMDPEYFVLQKLSTKIDVYSFGVVLLEMLSGYKAVHYLENGERRTLVDFVVPYIVRHEIHKVLDPKVAPPTPFEMEALAYVGFLALVCVSLRGQDRPSMTEIVNSLKSALDTCRSEW